MTKPDAAAECFKSGFNCSQAIVSTFGPALGLPRDRALKAAAAFGGGMGRMGKTCGAVTGAFMVIGLKHGMTRADDVEARKKTYKLVGEFVQEFNARNKTIECKELLGCDLSTDEGLKMAMKKDFHHPVCPKFIKDAAEILEKLL